MLQNLEILQLNFPRVTYIAFIDSDDIWKKNKLKKQIQFMQKNKCNFSFTSYSIINEKNEILAKRNVFLMQIIKYYIIQIL